VTVTGLLAVFVMETEQLVLALPASVVEAQVNALTATPFVKVMVAVCV
jgi:hypothetical protein